MSYLLDANVISETRKRRPEPKVLRWLESSAPDALYVSVLTFGEVAKGIQLRQRQDPLAAAALEEWLRGLGEQFSDRIVPVDQEIANCWGDPQHAGRCPYWCRRHQPLGLKLLRRKPGLGDGPRALPLLSVADPCIFSYYLLRPRLLQAEAAARLGSVCTAGADSTERTQSPL